LPFLFASGGKNMAATPVKIERVKRELTQVALAARSGVPQYRISSIERGAKPHADEATALALVLETTTAELFGETS
jgi:transcriptional regulator with XRE-family HTH domain